MKLFFIGITFLLALAKKTYAIEEPYVNELKGTQVAVGNSFIVEDEKFGGTSTWTSISVSDIVSFEINFDTSIYFYNKPFSCTANFKIYIYNNPSDTSQITDSVTHANINLQILYDTTTGKSYRGVAFYKFKDAYKYKVKILGMTCAQLSPIPPIFRLKGEVIVNRNYNFSDNSVDITRYKILSGNQLELDWTPSNYSGAEMFDVEYTHVDYSSQVASSVLLYQSGTDYTVPLDSLAKWFKNNSTRITTSASSYVLNVPYDSGFVLFRIRGVQIHYPDNIRWEGNWNYNAKLYSSACSSGCPTGVVFFTGHEVTLNWQYSATFAEEGKRKEVISYFDGSLRNRQAITLNNSDNKTIVQESIYDILGRPSVNILPVPTDDNTLHYFKGFNNNTGGNPYSFSDLSENSCVTTAAGMDSSSGASKYYSANNPFLNNYYYAKYIPSAHNYPFTVTQYVADNTGRILDQGGVDTTFQIGHGHETKYFYGQPSQPELDRLFGSEAGNASHYLKNMVVDPNGQISVSYVDANGKTVATALAGSVPSNLHALPSNAGATVTMHTDLTSPGNFSANSSNYTISASSTFLAHVTGMYTLNYEIDPLRYEKLFGPNKDSILCNSCYYDLLITVKDNCENVLSTATHSAGNVFDTSCSNGTMIQGSLNVGISQIGEYYVYYELKLSQDALNFYDSVHLVKNSDIKKLDYFLLDELNQTDFSGCYNNCETCFDKLGSKPDFVSRFKSMFINDSLSFAQSDSLWAVSLYDSLYANCQTIQSECTSQNVCDEKLDLLKRDVSPGGQYALYDSNYALLERPINRLDTAWRHRISFFTDENGNRDSVTLHTTAGDDSVRVDVNSLNDSLFIVNWKDSWADSLVKLHPEYCHYLWCVTNSNSYEFDRQVEDWQESDTVMSLGLFDPNNYHALLDHDPFFASGGLGVPYYNQMKDSLRLFSRTKMGLAASDKNILQFVDVILYCNNQSYGWDNCHPDSACRARNREWFLYKELYLNLKQKFYETARRTSTNPTFANCINCFIGKDLINIATPLGCDDLTNLVDSFNVFRNQIDTNQVYLNKRITQAANEFIHSANALVEAKSTYPSTVFTEDYCFNGTSLTPPAKLHAVRLYAPNGRFHTIAPLSLQCSQLFSYPYSQLHNNPVVDTDFCSGHVNPSLAGNDYFAVTINRLDSAFQVLWSHKNSTSYAYYGTSSPLFKFLPDTAAENQVFVYGFIRMNGNYPDYNSYLTARTSALYIPLDSILHVRNLRFATEKLPSNYTTINDTLNFSYLKVSLDMKNGSTIDAHLRAGYEGTGYVLYKQKIDSNEYSSDYQKAFTSYFNNRQHTNYSFAQIDSIFEVTCGKSPQIVISNTLFVDSSCNRHCSGGIYDPYDRDSISLYVEYGKPNVPPTSVPNGYNGRQFYSVFDLKSSATSSCRFFNVWVCVYDSTCAGGGGCHSTISYPSQCTASGTDTLYENKVRRYPEYVNTDNFINGILSSNQQQKSTQSEQDILDECHSNCEAQADYWISVLKKCSTDSIKLNNLKAALIDICSKGCSQNNPYGSSSIPGTTVATYHSFEEAIIGILGPGAINDSCTAELLSNPYPYNRQPVYLNRVITQSDFDICHKIGLRKQAYQVSGFSGSFHQWLKNTYGAAYTLDSSELNDLLKSCSSCNGILNNNITLPAVLDPQSSDCVHCDSVHSTLLAFQSKFPSIDSSKDNYEILFTNFFNHRLGYSLTYDQYKEFLDSCSANSSYSSVLCNEPAVTETTDSTGGASSCTAELFANALTNANNAYIVYIDSVHKDFRDAWMTKCLNVQPSLKMTANLYEYHYTLYYYDQSGNLVKTIPPEGVNLLDSAGIDTVKYIRLLTNNGCYQYSDSIQFNNNGKIFWNVNSFEAQPYTVETMVNLTSNAAQVVASKLTETHLLSHYQQEGFVIQIVNNKLEVDLYAANGLTGEDTAIAVSRRSISNLIPLNQWTHLAVEQTGNLADPLRIYINGQAIAFDYTINNLPQTTATGMTGAAPLMVGSHNASQIALPGQLRGSLKNLRVYNRLLSSDELRQNAFNPCQLPSNSTGLLFWSVLNDASNDSVLEMVTRTKGWLIGFNWTPTTGKFPVHRLATTYQYNSLNQVLQQYSPDGDTTQFFYDRLGRLIVSQNKEQKQNASYSGLSNRYSYTQYDALGRISEVGEKSNPSSDVRAINLLDTTAVKSWMTSGTDRQVTKTIYDNPINLDYQSISTARKRVVASIYLENKTDAEGDSTLYGYDILGNVNTLVQHVKALVAADPTNGKKRINYDYDLVSGKVNMVSYQPGKGDQFFYKYLYDADNRVISSYSSRDQLVWTEDASYLYYLHGPLARTELGNYKVQGTDYAYTLQGWLKGINSDSLAAVGEMGNDGWPNTAYSRVSRDVYGFKLGYYSNDYVPIGGSAAGAFKYKNYTTPTSLDNTGNQLFNGNISTTILALSKINSGAATGYSYGYDQLNRLVEMRQHTTGTTGGWNNSNIVTAYRESIAYDANGNILKYLRNGTAATPNMDSLTYNYNLDANGKITDNKLNYVRDQVSSSNYSVDIDNQSANNYVYDLIGNLKKDVSEGIDTIRWTVYGKINKIVKNGNTIKINYGYDAGGNRTTKIVSGSADTTTFYVRDAQGNVLAIYTKQNTNPLKWSEQDLYGSSRLGLWRWDTIVPTAPPVVTGSPIYDSLLLGSRTYELTNHLGNVLATISDKKIGNDSSGVANYYIAEVLSQNDYYPFGMLMQGRNYRAGVNYRYGFNGKENDNEVKGESNQQDYGMRIYDPRLGRFLSLDPLTKNYPELTPYQFSSNTPIVAVDLDGLEAVTVTGTARGTYLLITAALNGTVAVGPNGISFFIAPELGLGAGVSISAGVSVGVYPHVTDTRQLGGWGMNLGATFFGNGGDISGSLQQRKDGTPEDVKFGGGAGIPKIGGGAGAEGHLSFTYAFYLGTVKWEDLEKVLPNMAEEFHIPVEKLKAMIKQARDMYDKMPSSDKEKTKRTITLIMPKDIHKPKSNNQPDEPKKTSKSTSKKIVTTPQTMTPSSSNVGEKQTQPETKSDPPKLKSF